MKLDSVPCDGQATNNEIPPVILENSGFYRRKLPLNTHRTCSCKPNHLNCMTAKEWLKSQQGYGNFGMKLGIFETKMSTPPRSLFLWLER